ncbi:MAG: phosphoribosylanthranilate isomerase [Opitutales bacterium]
MIGRTLIKVCGITRTADAAVALDIGADYLGVNCWPGSPRHVAPERRAALLREIPAEKRVAVTVNPSADEVAGLVKEGFAVVQAHYDPAEKACDPSSLSSRIGRQRLWLAPRLADGAPWPAGLLELAAGFVHDAHDRKAFGGTGTRSDWKRYVALLHAHPGSLWVLAGGLSPDNVHSAVHDAGASCLDLNSGVELAPGLKSAAKLHEVRQRLHNNGQS